MDPIVRGSSPACRNSSGLQLVLVFTVNNLPPRDPLAGEPPLWHRTALVGGIADRPKYARPNSFVKQTIEGSRAHVPGCFTETGLNVQNSPKIMHLRA